MRIARNPFKEKLRRAKFYKLRAQRSAVSSSFFNFQWNLVCDRAWLRATGDSLFMVGVMLGSMIFGCLSDKFGRRPIFFLSLVIQLVGGILVAVAPEFISYVIFRLIVGSTTSGVFLVAYVIGKSLSVPLKRNVRLSSTFTMIPNACQAHSPTL